MPQDIPAQIPVPGIQRASAAKLVDPVPSFSFYVEIDHILEARFLECSGLSIKRELYPHKEGGMNDGVHNLPGRLTYGNLTLRHGITFSTALWQWYMEGCIDGKVSYRSISVHQFVPYTTIPVRKYDLQKAFPVSWTGPQLRSDSNEISVESIEIAFTRFTVSNQ